MPALSVVTKRAGLMSVPAPVAQILKKKLPMRGNWAPRYARLITGCRLTLLPLLSAYVIFKLMHLMAPHLL